jgi:hypothetical protein
MQSKVDEYYGMFLQAVADGRGDRRCDGARHVRPGPDGDAVEGARRRHGRRVATFDETLARMSADAQAAAVAADPEPEPPAATTPDRSEPEPSEATTRAPKRDLIWFAQPRTREHSDGIRSELRAQARRVKSRMQEMDGEPWAASSLRGAVRVGRAEGRAQNDRARRSRARGAHRVRRGAVGEHENRGRADDVPGSPAGRRPRRRHLRPEHDPVVGGRPRRRPASSATARCGRSRRRRSRRRSSTSGRAGHIERLLDTIDGEGGLGKVAGELARRILVTGSPPTSGRSASTSPAPLTSRSSARCRSAPAPPAASRSSTRSTRRSSRRRTSASTRSGRRAVETLAGTNEWKARHVRRDHRRVRGGGDGGVGQRADARAAGHHRREGAGVRAVLDRARPGLGRAPGRDGVAAAGREGRPRGDEVRGRRRPRLVRAEGHHHGATATTTAAASRRSRSPTSTSCSRRSRRGSGRARSGR